MNVPIQPEPPAQPVANYQPASVVISGGEGHVVNVGQAGPSIKQQTWPQRLASHTIGYWVFHFVLALAAVVFWESLVLAYHAVAHH